MVKVVIGIWLIGMFWVAYEFITAPTADENEKIK